MSLCRRYVHFCHILDSTRKWHRLSLSERLQAHPPSCRQRYFILSLAEQRPLWGLPGGTSRKEPVGQCGRYKRRGFGPWVGAIPWKRSWYPIAVFSPREPHGQRSPVGYRPWGRPEQDTTERPSRHRRRSAAHAHRVSSTRSGCRLAERGPLAWLPDRLLLHWKATAPRGPCMAGAPSPSHTLTVGGGGQRGSTQQQLRSPTCGGFTKSATSHSRFPSSSIWVTETPLSLVMTETWGSGSCSW